jgi:conjugal transfer pilus assembly protein TraV
MTHIKSSLLVLIGLACVGCSSMNDQTECRATATDSCYTIEQVDDMTSYVDDAIPIRRTTHQNQSGNETESPQGSIVAEKNGSSVWLAEAARGKSWA